MKKARKLFAMFIAMIMAVVLAVPAFAASGTYTITINNSTKGHTYEAYQVFAGDLSGSVLSNIVWGDGVKGAELLTALQGDNTIGSTFTGCENAADVAAKLTSDNGFTYDSVKMKTFADIVGLHLTTTTSGTCDKGTASVDSYTYKISGVAAGYYLIQDKDPAEGSSIDAYTRYILKVVGNVNVTPKSDVPEFEKKVQDTDDTAGTTTGWQDSADWDIGDKVPFQLKGTVASNYDAYKTYQFIFHDQESTGLTFDSSSVKVYVDGTEIKSGYDVVTSGLEGDDCTFEVVFDNLKEIPSVKAKSVITVEYQSTLNENAVIGSTGNPNTAKLEFSNNPNDEQGGETGTTPEDTVIVFTYKTVINKVDSATKPLAGAAFQLEKFVADKDGDETYNSVTGTWTVVGTTTAGDATSFTFSGLDDGYYRLTETTTPSGYNTIDPIYFTITAEHGTTIISLNGNATTGEITFTPNEGEGSLTTTVVNNSGLELPQTGGIGTTVFYILGGILVIGASVVLIVRRRMNTDK